MAQETRSEVVVGVGAPIAVEGVDDVGIGDRTGADEAERACALHGQRKSARCLGVAARLVGARGTGVVDREGVEAVVLLGPERGEVGAPCAVLRAGQSQPQQALVEAVGVVTAERDVAA